MTKNNNETAVMLFHHNGGMGRFRAIEDVESDNVDVRTLAKEKLLEEIMRQQLNATQKSNLVDKYLKAQGTGGYNNAQYGRNDSMHADAITCASCGVRNFDPSDASKNMKEYLLENLDCFKIEGEHSEVLNDLLCSHYNISIPTSSNGDSKTINPYMARSFFKYPNQDGNCCYYELHREFIDAEKTANADNISSVSNAIILIQLLI